MISCHDVTSWRHVNTYHHSTVLTNLVVEAYWDYYTNSMLIWVVGIKQIIDTIFESCRQHDTTSRHDVMMWRHAIVWNWSNTSMPSIITCQLTSFTYILLNCSILSSYDQWNEICDIVTRSLDHDVSHDPDVTAWSKAIMQLLMLWQFLIEWSKQPCIHGHRIICLATPHANIDGVSYVM